VCDVVEAARDGCLRQIETFKKDHASAGRCREVSPIIGRCSIRCTVNSTPCSSPHLTIIMRWPR
jgi:hypothetical protein